MTLERRSRARAMHLAFAPFGRYATISQLPCSPTYLSFCSIHIYTYVTINTSIIFFIFPNGRRIARCLPSYIRAGIMAGKLATSDVGGERRQWVARKTPASAGGNALRGR